jgi:hypothetical protein
MPGVASPRQYHNLNIAAAPSGNHSDDFFIHGQATGLNRRPGPPRNVKLVEPIYSFMP